MPSKSPAQKHLMAAVAHNPSFAKNVGIPQSVGKEFNQADQVKKSHNLSGSPQSREEHMQRRTRHTTQKATGKEFGVSQPTVSRKTMAQGFKRGKMD